MLGRGGGRAGKGRPARGASRGQLPGHGRPGEREERGPEREWRAGGPCKAPQPVARSVRRPPPGLWSSSEALLDTPRWTDLRTRILIKQERRKQKEYFEKKRLKSKMKLLGVSSPVKNSAASLDLLNLYMVNQISCQRKMPETVRKPIHVNMNKDIKMPGRKQALELPMSPPCRPSNLCIDDLGNNVQYQIRGSKEEHGPVQLSNVYYSDSLASKLYDNRDVSISPYKAVQSVTSFQRLNSPGNVLPGRPAVTSEDGGSLGDQRLSGICTDKKPAQSMWAENAEDAPNFLEYVNQSTPNFLPKNCDSFISPNMINLLNVDQQIVKKNFDCIRDVHAAASCGNNCPTDSCTRLIFTGPELNFSTSTANKTSYPEPCWSNRNYQNQYSNNKGNKHDMGLQKDAYPTNSFQDAEKKGIFAYDCQEKMPQKQSKKYPLHCMSNNLLEELHPKHSWDTQLGEVVMVEGQCTHVLKGHNSPQSSPCTSYSPQQTDSSFSSSSEIPSEEEDSVLPKMQEPERSLHSNVTSDNVHLERTARLLGDEENGDSTSIHQQNDQFHRLSMKNSCDHFSQSHVVQDESTLKFLPQGARCDMGTQTESWPVGGVKADVAVQCQGLCPEPCDAEVQTEAWPVGTDKAVQCGDCLQVPVRGL